MYFAMLELSLSSFAENQSGSSENQVRDDVFHRIPSTTCAHSIMAACQNKSSRIGGPGQAELRALGVVSKARKLRRFILSLPIHVESSRLLRCDHMRQECVFQRILSVRKRARAATALRKPCFGSYRTFTTREYGSLPEAAYADVYGVLFSPNSRETGLIMTFPTISN